MNTVIVLRPRLADEVEGNHFSDRPYRCSVYNLRDGDKLCVRGLDGVIRDCPVSLPNGYYISVLDHEVVQIGDGDDHTAFHADVSPSAAFLRLREQLLQYPVTVADGGLDRAVTDEAKQDPGWRTKAMSGVGSLT
jgi:hypothetical protein